MSDEILVGFDVRALSAADPAWTDELRSMFLLREVARPWSVDRWVWPPTIPRPPWTMRGIAFVDPDQARAACGPGQVVVAITVHDRPVAKTVPFHALERPADWERWRCAGYDVADAFLLSGLTNCGWGDGKAAWAARWAGQLNEVHLLPHGAVAARLAEETDGRVVEHAPFFAYGIYVDPR